MPKDKLDQLCSLHYAKGYASSMLDLVKMLHHLKGTDEKATITIGDLSGLINLAIESLPQYQEYKTKMKIK